MPEHELALFVEMIAVAEQRGPPPGAGFEQRLARDQRRLAQVEAVR